MNCWKSINVYRDFGICRIVFISILSALISFVSLYLFISIINPNVQLKADGLFLFITILVLLKPLHNMLHLIPLYLFLKKIHFSINWKRKWKPVLTTKICQSVSKELSILSILAPTLGLSIPFIIGALLFPAYMHYFLILAACHIGLSVTDFMYLSLFLKAPKKCMIESFEDGYDILVSNHQ